jgi:serine/threonine protein kinase
MIAARGDQELDRFVDLGLRHHGHFSSRSFPHFSAARRRASAGLRTVWRGRARLDRVACAALSPGEGAAGEGTMTADEAFAHALAPGTEVQGYRIISVLGAGGFGVTYLAEHVAMNHRVALKEFLPGGIATRAKTGDTVHPLSPAHAEDYVWGLARFRDEARTLARLKHPGIVAVMNYFEANGTAYCAMEHVTGDTLDARLGPRGRLDAATLARMVPPLLDGIEAVHAAGFLHRDIKPGNILLNERGPVLIDFGAARQALGAHSRSLTAVLSEGYAPYEQYQRDGDQGPWTDIYALGGTLYRCVTGERPPEATKRIQARIKQKPDPLVPASEAATGRYPAPLLAAIDAALAAMEGDRPQFIAALRAMIEPRPGPSAGDTLIAGGAPSSVPRVDPAPVLGKPRHAAGRRRWPAVAAAVLILGGAGAAAYVVLGERNAQEREAERIAAEARRKAEEEAKRKAEQEEARPKRRRSANPKRTRGAGARPKKPNSGARRTRSDAAPTRTASRPTRPPRPSSGAFRPTIARISTKPCGFSPTRFRAPSFRRAARRAPSPPAPAPGRRRTTAPARSAMPTARSRPTKAFRSAGPCGRSCAPRAAATTARSPTSTRRSGSTRPCRSF